MQIKHLKSALISLNQKQKKILDPNLLGKNNKVLSNKVLKQWGKSPDPKLRRMSSYFNYESNSRKEVYPSDFKKIANSLTEQGYVACSKQDLQNKIEKAGYLASQRDDQQKLAKRREKKAQKLARQNEIYNKLGMAQNTKPLNSQPINQNAESPVKPPLVSSFWQITKKQVLNDHKSPSIGFTAAKPITIIADAGIKTRVKISLAV